MREADVHVGDALPPGWCRDASGLIRRETIHSMLRRLSGWDYRKPWIYQITLVCANRPQAPLGRILVREKGGERWLPLAEARQSKWTADRIEAKVERSVLGDEIFRLFRRFGEFTPEIKPLYCEAMPDHLHFIVRVTREMKRPLGNAIGGFKTGCEKLYRAAGGAAGGAGVGAAGGAGVGAAGGAGLVPRATARGWFSALGNRFLLQRPLAQVQVSRRDFGYRRVALAAGGGLKIARDAAGAPLVDFATSLFAEKKAALFAAARHGAVLISPCVSDGERQIAREALAAGLPLVTMQNKGFSKLQKPSGRYFDACADGRLLMLAPAAWPYQPGEKRMTRFDATAMNRLCQWIVGETAAEINYHGMRPANIDALARQAAKVAL